MMSFPAAMLIGLVLGGWVVYCVMSGERRVAQTKPTRLRYYFRMLRCDEVFKGAFNVESLKGVWVEETTPTT